MPRKNAKAALILLAALAMLATTVNADEVVLHDGSVLVGEIDRTIDGELKITTDFAGELNIPWDKVAGLRTGGEYAVATPEGEHLVGRLQYSEAGGFRVSSASRGDVRLEAAEVLNLWPADGPNPAALAAEELRAKYADPWSGVVGLGISGAEGNSEKLDVAGRAAAVREGERDTIKLSAVVNYSEQDGEESANEVIVAGRLERNLSERSFIYGGAGLETDKFEDLDLRAILTGGYGRKFRDEEDFKFSGRLGLGVDYSTFRSGGSETVGLLEVGYDLQKDYGETLRFDHTFVLYPELEEFGDNYRAVADFGATVPVGDADDWAVRLGLNFQYDSAPSPGVDKLDTTYLVNLLYKFGD